VDGLCFNLGDVVDLVAVERAVFPIHFVADLVILAFRKLAPNEVRACCSSQLTPFPIDCSVPHCINGSRLARRWISIFLKMLCRCRGDRMG